MSQKMPVKGFKQVEDISEFDEWFSKCYNEKHREGYFLDFYIQYPEKLSNVPNNLPFLPERMKIKKVEKTCFYFT